MAGSGRLSEASGVNYASKCFRAAAGKWVAVLARVVLAAAATVTYGTGTVMTGGATFTIGAGGAKGGGGGRRCGAAVGVQPSSAMA